MTLVVFPGPELASPTRWNFRASRGGSRHNGPTVARGPTRSATPESHAHPTGGFRLVLEIR